MIGVVVYPGFQLLDASGPIAAFEVARRYRPHFPKLRVLAAKPGLVTSSSGVAIAAEPLSLRGLSAIVVVGGDGVTQAVADPALRMAMRRAHAKGLRIASVCSGAYVLAQAGLLDGRRATTHWGRSADFQQRFPAVRLDADCIYVRDGDIWTSAGVSAGIDLALAMIRCDLGDEVARAVARQLVVYHRRPGGQSQFSALDSIAAESDRFDDVMRWARGQLGRPLTVERLAEQAGMSPRHFSRAFRAQTGLTPAKAVERLRLEVAHEQVQATPAPIEVIAVRSGFHDAKRMRRAFLRAFGQPPQALRRAARAT
jgi:transcriptional regulator GlxA family with amidase domain